MPTFEVSAQGKTFEVEAPSFEAAVAALKGTSTPSVGEALNLGGGQGLTAGFSDELAGLSAAAGKNPILGGSLGRLIEGAAKLGYGAMTGNNAPSKAYATARDKARAEQAAAEAAHPVASGLATVGGAVASLPFMPGVSVAKGAGLLPRIANAATEGGIYGALFGAGQGKGAADTALQGSLGGLIGAAGGAVTPPVTSSLGQLGRMVSAPFRGAFNQRGEAQRQVVRAIEANLGKGSAPTAAKAMERTQAAGTPLLPIELGGSYTTALADSAAVRSPAARDVLQSALQPRYETQAERLTNLVQDIAGGSPDAGAAIEGLQRAARKANSPAYRAAYQAGDFPIWSPELEQLASSPDVVAAMKRAVETGKTRAVAEGYGGFNPSFSVTEDGRLIFNRAPNGVPTYPNLQTWDYVYRNLRDAARKEGGSLGQAMAQNARQLRDILDTAVPSYAQARAGAAKFFGAADALEAGQKFFSSSKDNNAARRALAKMSKPERELFAAGYASRMLNAIKEVPERSDLLKRKIFASPAARERTKIALGDTAARRLEAQTTLESLMEHSRQAVQGNSKTAQRLIDAGIVGVGAGYDYGHEGHTYLGPALIVGALLKTGRRELSARVAAELGRLLASGNADDLRKAAAYVADHPGLLSRLQEADRVITRGAAAAAVPNLGVGPLLFGPQANR